MVDVPQSQARHLMRSSVALNVSDGVESPETHHHATVEDSLNNELFEIHSDAQSVTMADEPHRVLAKGKLKSTKNQASLPVNDYQRHKDSQTPGKLATAHASLAALKAGPITTEERYYNEIQEDILSSSEEEPDSSEDVDEYQPPAKKMKAVPRSNQAYAKTKPGAKSKPKPKGKQKAKQKAKPQQSKTQKGKVAKKEIAHADLGGSDGSRQNSPAHDPQPVHRSAVSHMQAQRIERKPKLLLVDEQAIKKAAIIAFDEHGPLNQGRSSLPPSAVATRQRDLSLPVSGTKRKRHNEPSALSAAICTSQGDSDGDPLGGYAKHMPERAWKARPQQLDRPAEAENDHAAEGAGLSDAAALSSDHTDAHDDELPQHPDVLNVQQFEAVQTVSQRAMPPPARPTELQGQSDRATVAVKQHQDRTPASEASTEVPEVDKSSEKPKAKQETSAASAPPAALEQACADDSGYHSTVQPVAKGIKTKHTRYGRFDLQVDQLGSPSIAQPRELQKEAPQAQLKEKFPQQEENGHKKAADTGEASLQDFARKLTRNYVQVFPSEHTSIPSRNASSPATNNSRMHEAAEDHRQDEIMNQILAWRADLAEHHTAMFDSLLVDAYHVVSQVARREHLMQGRINSYRQKGQKLIKELAHTYEWEVKEFRGANVR